jgi:intracellular septation protein A
MVADSRYRFTASINPGLLVKNMSRVSDFWIGGDFSLPDMNWSSLTVTSNQYSYAMTDTYLDILRNCNVEQIVDFPTRGNKTLDIFLTSNPGLILCSI